MNYGRVFTQSWQIVWRHKFLWLLGLVAGLGPVAATILRVAYFPQLRQWVSGPAPAVFDPASIAEPEQFFSRLLGGTAVFFVASTGYWLAATVAQGAIIGAAIDLEKERPSSFRRAVRQGVGVLGRFIAIDALVFFPLFLLLALLMLLATGGLLTIAILTRQGSGVEPVTAVLALALICLLPLTCLLFPVGLLTSVFRGLAFRDTAVRQTGVRESIGHTWRVVRRQWGTVLVLLLLLWGIQYLPGMLLSALALPLELELGAAVSPVIRRWLGWIVGVGTAVPLAILHAFIATAWTLAYKELAGWRVGE